MERPAHAGRKPDAEHQRHDERPSPHTRGLATEQEPVHEADVHGEVEPEAEGEEPRAEGERAAKAKENGHTRRERYGQERRDRDHPGYGSQSEDEQVDDGGIWTSHCREDQQRDGRAPR